MALFSVEGVKFSSRTQDIIKGVSMEIEMGSVTGLLGRSGSGKSTLLKLVAGILVPTGGRVLFDGKDIQLMSNVENKTFRRRCSYVFQDSALWANQTIEQNLNLPLQTHNQSMSRDERSSRIRRMCEIVRFNRPLSLRPVDLSMGEQKRVAFARALINDPEVLFLDECTESLDQDGSDHILSLLVDFINSGKTVIYVSHRSEFIDIMNRSRNSCVYDIDAGFLRGADDYEI